MKATILAIVFCMLVATIGVVIAVEKISEKECGRIETINSETPVGKCQKYQYVQKFTQTMKEQIQSKSETDE